MMTRLFACAAALALASVMAPDARAADADASVQGTARPKRTPDEEAEDLVKQAEDAVQRKSWPIARTALERVIKMYGNTSAASRAKALLRDVPNERGRLLMGFDEDSDVGGTGMEWITDQKIVPVGKGCVHIANLRNHHVRFPIKSDTLTRMKSVNFWVWSVANSGGLSTGTTYFCLYTDDPQDFLSASFQLRGDGEWRLIDIGPGRFKEHKETKGRRFTAVGFWNPVGTEVRDFLADDIRVIEEDPPKSGSMLNASSEGKGLPPLSPPK
jgi:hypothetical protein